MKKLYLVLLFFFLFAPTLFAQSISSNRIGTLSTSSTILDFDGQQVITYNALELNYVPVSSLRELGFYITYDASTGIVTINPPTQLSQPFTSIPTLSLKPYTLYTPQVWIGDFRTHAIVSEGNVLIPIGALRQLYHIDIDGTTYKMTLKAPLHITATASLIKNDLPTPISVSIIDLYWDNGFIMQPSKYDLKPFESLPRFLEIIPSEKINKLYITTLIQSATGRELNYSNTNMFGQTNSSLFKYVSKLNELSSLDLGDPIDIETLIWAESTINQKGLSSNTSYLVWTNIDLQRTFIFQSINGNWKLIKHFLCSTGKSYSPTPKGTFALTKKVPYFGVEKGYRCKNAFGFIGTTYLYHSVMFDKTGSYLLKGTGELGKPASAGCIRLSVANSEWFYSNMLSGTKVIID